MIDKLRQRLDEHRTKRSFAIEQIKQEKIILERLKDDLDTTSQAQAILQRVAQTVQQQAHKRVSIVVSKCLKMVFGPSYSFEIKFEKKRSKTEAKIFLLKDGQRIEPLDAAGGGIVDIVAFALRLSYLSLKLPKPRPFIALDEPFRFVSSAYRPRVRAMLEVLAEELEFQFLVVSHQRQLITGKVYEL